MKRILIAVNSFSDTHMRQIQSAASGWADIRRIDQSSPIGSYADAMNNADIVVGWPPAKPLSESNIRFTQLCSAGYDPYLQVGLEHKRDFILCNARGVFSIPAAEQVLAIMLMLSRQLNAHVRDQLTHTWERAPAYRIVTGDTVCVVGLGSIGQAIAERCAGIGMKVIGVTRSGKEPASPPVSRIYGFDRLADAVKEADHVAVSLPASPRTEGAFNETMFRQMKRGSCFYNVGRGSLVVEDDLVKVLRDGHLWGAGLDVFQTEPLPKESPLWDLPNVVIAPHTAGRYTQEFDRLCDLFAGNLERYRNNQPLHNVIDLKKKNP